MPAVVAPKGMVERPDGRSSELNGENSARIAQIRLNRAYYDGSQKDAFNEALVNVDDGGRRPMVPEHEKLVAYSTQIQECIDYLSGQLAQGFQVIADDSTVAEIIAGTLAGSPELASDDDDEATTIVAQVAEALIAGDVAVHVRWDPEAQMPWLEFWESEEVDFQFEQDNRYKLERVALTEVVWDTNDAGESIEVERIRIWEMDPEQGLCVIRTLIDGTEDSALEEVLPFQFIPWRMWRGMRKKLRKSRGESLITPRIRALADRYDAAGQLSFVVGRYNSHGNLAVIGDSALLQINQDARISKDVADVLTFPGGTALEVIKLDADATMIEHQTALTTDAIYSAFGITRLDTSTMEGLGNLSGYALEILNRKTGSTFDRIARQLARDIRSTLNVAVDVYATMTNPTVMIDEGDELGEDVLTEQESVEYDAMFPNRAMKIILGSGYIVDTVMQRDDYTVGLVSRRWVLQQRGLDDKEIDRIEEQIAKERPAATTVTLSPAAVAASAGSSVQAGATLSSIDAGGMEG